MLPTRKKFDNPLYLSDGNDTEKKTPQHAEPRRRKTYSFKPAVGKSDGKRVYEVGFIRVYVVFVVFFLLTLLSAFLKKSGAYSELGESSFYALQCVIYALIFIVPTVIYCKKERRGFIEASGLCRFSHSVWTFLILSLLLLAFVIAAEKFSISYFFTSAFEEASVNLATAENPLLIVLSQAIFPAVCEEIAFRGLVRTEISEKAGGFTGIIVSSIAFALVHLDFRYFIVYFSSGLILAIAAHVSASVIPCIAIHAVNNVFSLYFSSRLTFIAAERTGNTFILISLVICIFVILLFYLKSIEQICVKKAVCESLRRKHGDGDEDMQVCYGKQYRMLSDTGYTLHKFLRYLFSPALIVAFALFLFATVL